MSQIQTSQVLIIAGLIISLVIGLFITVFLLYIQKRSFAQHKNLEEMKQAYEELILQSQIEVQNNTLQYVSEEIHDNIGQLLSTVNLKMSMIVKKYPDEYTTETKQILQDTITEVRNIGRVLSTKKVAETGLISAVEILVKRLEKNDQFKLHFNKKGIEKNLDEKTTLVLFRMVQEILHNAIKHSNCKNIHLLIEFTHNDLQIVCIDDGKGFNTETIHLHSETLTGSGIQNLISRAKLINGHIIFNTPIEGGLTIVITKKLE